MDFNTLKGLGLEYFQKGKEVAVDVTARGKVEVQILNNKAKLHNAQRQLGALVYSLAKGKEENQPLVDKYIDSISSIEAEIERLTESIPKPAPTEEMVDVPVASVDTVEIMEPVVSEEVVAPEMVEVPLTEDVLVEEPVIVAEPEVAEVVVETVESVAPVATPEVPEVKTCPVCGEPVVDGTLFCTHCGSQA